MAEKKQIYRIGIDARFYGPIGKGLGRYQQEIVDNILKMDEVNEYVIFLSPANYDFFQERPPRIRKVLARSRWYTLSEQISMPYLIWRESLDLMHFPHFNAAILCPVPFLVTIHDLILVRYPTPRASTLGPWLYKIKNRAYWLVVKTALRRARRIIAVSEFTKKDIIEIFSISPEKIRVIYEGVANLAKGRDDLFADIANPSGTLAAYGLNKKFFLYVGNAYQHKNLEGLLELFQKMLANGEIQDYQLVLVGKEDYFYRRLKRQVEKMGLWAEKKSANPVVFTGYVPDKDLEVFYQQATAYIFPSFYEGFGLPPLEAMAKGCPVISSNQTCLPEILGSAALYFNPAREDEMRACLLKITNFPAIRQALIEKGKEQAKKYSWWECAREHWQIYHGLLN